MHRMLRVENGCPDMSHGRRGKAIDMKDGELCVKWYVIGKTSNSYEHWFYCGLCLNPDCWAYLTIVPVFYVDIQKM